jgi:hypothetical protein
MEKVLLDGLAVTPPPPQPASASSTGAVAATMRPKRARAVLREGAFRRVEDFRNKAVWRLSLTMVPGADGKAESLALQEEHRLGRGLPKG